jgi:paraquat-inducible protein A
LNDVNKSLQIACHHCDLICEIPKLGEHQVALCPVCDGTMAQGAAKNPDNVIPIAITALILFGLSLPFSFISFSKQGLVQSIHLLDAAAMMLLYNQPFLSALINITIIFLPISILVFILLLHGKAISLLPKKIQIFSTKALFQVKEWSMPEIFLVGVLVSLVKMISLAEVALGLSFWAYAGFVVCFVYTLVKLDKMAIWDKIDHHSQFSQSPTGVRAVDLNIAACPQCEILTSEHHCPRCATKVIVRDPHNLQKTVALIITSALLYIPANLYPIMTTVFLGSPEPATIIGGVALLWQHGSYPIALVIFVASVFVPLAKLTTLSILTWVVKKQAKHRQIPFTKIYAITEFLGKWSMVDVFVVAILVALVHLGGIVEIQPGPGALYFSAMVIVSMLAAHTFDPRQLWDIEQEGMM